MGATKPTDNKENTDHQSMQKLEEALVICKLGRFHFKLFVATMSAVFTATMVTTTSSYILPNAECDLKMTIYQKGLLNAMPFFGQVGAALFTGFLTDAFGRKIFLVSGHIGIFLCGILEGSSQTYWMLIVGKLLEGIFLSLCFSTTAAMVTEFIHKNVRDRVLLMYSGLMSVSLAVAALMSWAILPQKWDFVIIEDYFVLHSWNIYLYICSIWSLIAAVMYYILPESPKFLLSHGQENEALEVVKRIYVENTGNGIESFPITSLTNSETYIPTKKLTVRNQINSALHEVKGLFKRPLLTHLIMFCVNTFVCLLAYSALRLWYPQLSTIVENYQTDHNRTDRFCVMINDYMGSLAKNNSRDIQYEVMSLNETNTCIPNLSGAETYTNGIILGAASLICILISASLVNHFGQKPLMFVYLLLCSAGSGSLYWSNSSLVIAVLMSITIGFMQSAFSLQHNIVVRVFPTTLRSLALSIIVMLGRVGSLLGNVLFPITLELGCMTPFLSLSVITLGVAGLVYFLPNPNKESNDK